ncbi:DUF4123 domain-containing protein [Burkholderia ambifaria]|uniref:DUF4123 domain-containing protein n=1 Tax=Burkholderia ambifaria TaxID=152480 RepID=A0AA41E774_9BURK|nr:DUF4123 domain-containing protein [Burkholderia ambifaria]MBR8129701.1 DUF4123 domain-containing protein [Burkholderia ambifaria]PRD98235.1 hypothetical protein C6P77_20345 [Burkholderia ambifaria]
MMNTPNNRVADRADGLSASSENAVIDATASVLHAYFDKHPEMRCLLVVDPSQRDLPSDDGSAFSELKRTIVTIAHDGFPAEQQPYLVELDLRSPAGAMQLKESVRLAFEDRRPVSMAQGLGQRIGGWLASTACADEVAGHWSTQVLQYDERGRLCALRFYDTRALGLIWPLLTEQQQQALLGPVTVWHALDVCAKPRAYGRGVGSSRACSLTAAQWQEVHRHGLINRALALHALAANRQPTPAEVDAAVAAAARAEQYGLQDRDDLIAFIGHALDWHPQFDRHPEIEKALKEFSPDDFYTAAIGHLQPDDIDEIRQGAWYGQAASLSDPQRRPSPDTRYE